MRRCVVNDRQLESFVLTCECGSLTQAANRSNISVPAFVQQINLLEREVGFRLFERGPRGVTPTPAGLELERAAREILGKWEEAVAHGRRLEERRRRTLRVACDPSSIPPFMVQICTRTQELDGTIAFSFVETPYSEQVDSVAKGLADACFFVELNRFAALGVEFHPLYREGFCACVPPTSPLAGRPSVRWEDIAGMKMFMEDVYRDETQLATALACLAAEGIELDIDNAPFDAALPAHIALEGGVMPCPTSYLVGSAPPLVAIPMDMPESTYGIVCRPGTLSSFGAFETAAREHFA